MEQAPVCERRGERVALRRRQRGVRCTPGDGHWFAEGDEEAVESVQLDSEANFGFAPGGRQAASRDSVRACRSLNFFFAWSVLMVM